MWKDVHRKTQLPWTSPKHLQLQTGQKLTRKVDQWNRFRFKVFSNMQGDTAPCSIKSLLFASVTILSRYLIAFRLGVGRIVESGIGRPFEFAKVMGGINMSERRHRCCCFSLGQFALPAANVIPELFVNSARNAADKTQTKERGKEKRCGRSSMFPLPPQFLPWMKMTRNRDQKIMHKEIALWLPIRNPCSQFRARISEKLNFNFVPVSSGCVMMAHGGMMAHVRVFPMFPMKK